MTDSEDVIVRCRQCGKQLGTATLRSASPRHLHKMVWILSRLHCIECERR